MVFSGPAGCRSLCRSCLLSEFDLAVSIVNYRTADLTLRCLATVIDALREVPDLAGRVVVVDNASGDGSDAVLGDWLQRNPELPVTLIRSTENTGFSGGHNLGMASVEADRYLLLNSDALLRPGFFPAMLAAAGTGAGMMAPRLEHDDGTPQVSCFRFPDPWSEVIRGAATGPVTRLLARHDVPLPVRPDPAEIEWASFACILLDGAMVRQIGPMDDGYFLYFEDVEYCLRARRAGWRIAHVPEARAVHLRGGSGPVKSRAAARKRLPAYYYASRTRYFRQAIGRLGPVAANLGWYSGRAIAMARRLTGQSVPPAADREWLDIWTNLRDPLGDRRATDT